MRNLEEECKKDVEFAIAQAKMFKGLMEDLFKVSPNEKEDAK